MAKTVDISVEPIRIKPVVQKPKPKTEEKKDAQRSK